MTVELDFEKVHSNNRAGAQYGREQGFWKIVSLSNLPYAMTMELTFENLYSKRHAGTHWRRE